MQSAEFGMQNYGRKIVYNFPLNSCVKNNLKEFYYEQVLNRNEWRC